MRDARSRPPAHRRLGGGSRLRITVVSLGWALVLYAGTHSPVGNAELAVIVNPEAAVGALTRAQIINIFFGRQRRLPSGYAALPIDLAGEKGEKVQFYRALAEKSLAEVHSYWARIVFSGQGSTPWQARSADEVLEIIADNRGAIGYIPADRVPAGVRIVYIVRD